MSLPVKGKGGLDKNNKYDRQLRLWGDHGQSALEGSRVCLINASATGTEIMKNLILPGIGSFTIVDGHKVKGEDVGNNFFLTPDSIGKSRAQATAEYLGELNDDVTGDFLEENVEDLLEKNPSFFTAFTAVIATQLPERTVLSLGRVLYEKSIPFVICRCYGFLGYLRVVVRDHTVIESHPDNFHEDLRLDKPFKGLQDFCNSLNLDDMTKKEHSHTPWLVLLYKYLQMWQQQHDGRWPSNFREKDALKETIKRGKLVNEEGVPEEEENFDEAVKNVNSSLHKTNVPSNIKALFEDPACTQLNSESKNFWVLLRAVKEFTEHQGEGFLPLRGTIPDMTADSERYIQLQNVYREKAQQDVSVVAQHVHSLLQDLGRGEPLVVKTTSKPGTISDSDIKLFCRNASFLQVVRNRSLDDEYNPTTANVDELSQHLLGEEEDSVMETDDVVWYVLLRAADRFHKEYDYYPGAYLNSVEADISKLKVCLGKLIHDWGLTANIKDDYIQEMCRFGASELHTVSALMGGVVAQEVIKVVTGQYLPINNTFIYNGSRQSSSTVAL